MVSENDLYEVRGRVALWLHALDETYGLLAMAIRARRARSDHRLADADNEYCEDFKRFRASIGRDMEQARDPYLAQDSDLFEHLYPPPFPRLSDLNGIERTHLLLAAVIFQQIWNAGEPNAGTVAKNNSLDELRENMELSLVNEGTISKDALDELKQKIKTARNKSIAHADGTAFGFEHGEVITKHKIIGWGLHEVSAEQWLELVLAMRRWLYEHRP